MLSLPIDIQPKDAVKEIKEINDKVTKGLEFLSKLKDEDVDIGTAPKETVYTEDKMKLYHYLPTQKDLFKTPVIIIYALVNRYLVADLQEDRSMVRNLVNEGLDTYLIEWGDPAPADKYLTVDDYINGYVDNCVDFLRERHGVDKVNVLGICQGGTLATCYSALHPDKVANLILTVTPIDFHAGRDKDNPDIGLLFRWGEGVDVDLMVDAYGNVPADVLNFTFLMVKPFALNFGKYHDMLDILDNEKAMLNFLRMEKWLFDGPDAAGEAYREFVRDFLRDNKLIKNEKIIGDQRVDLGNLTMPILNCYATADHLVPPPCSRVLAEKAGTKDYTEMAIPAGHIGIYVGGKAQKMLAPGIAEWLHKRA